MNAITIPPMRTYTTVRGVMARDRIRHDGQALDLHKRRGVPEPVHSDSGHGWVTRSRKPPPDLAELAAVCPVVREVGGVDGEAGKVPGLASGGAQRGKQ